MKRRSTLVLLLVAAGLLGAAQALPVPVPGSGDGVQCSGSTMGSAEDFSPVKNDGASGAWTDNRFTCYQVLPAPALGYHGHIHAVLANLDTADYATADADCPLVNLGVSTGNALVDCSFSSYSPPLPHGRYQLFVTSSPAGLVPQPVGSWAASVVMDR